ncbi:MAG TPA: hypothetical protein VHX65_08395 [Pirellulales bacterium]|jgi:hypothetical protein|nr:hypothetical protein [Pirellulales bacterium]
MSLAKQGRTQAEYDEEAILQHEREHDGAFHMEELAAKLLSEGWEVKIPSPKAILTRRLKRRSRELQGYDKQNRKRRIMHANKVVKIGPDGEPKTEVVWDHIDNMAWDHALSAFQQRFENTQKQDHALERDMGSFNDNNPNAVEHKIQKEMLFTYGDRQEQVVEKIEQDVPSKPKQPR